MATSKLPPLVPATKEEVEQFLEENRRWMEGGSAEELRAMTPEDQRRVMAGGTLVSCRDAIGVMRSRIRQAREREALLSGTYVPPRETGLKEGVAVFTEDGSGKLVKPASKEEVEAFIAANKRWMNLEAEELLKVMSPNDQKRVIAAGTLSGCRDPVAVVQTRAKRAREMELEFENLTSGRKLLQQVAAPSISVPIFSTEAAEIYVNAKPQEVRPEQSRFAPPPEESGMPGEKAQEAEGPLVGEVKGVGGVVEMLRAKYGCSKGQRMKVLGETGALLQFGEGKTVPKNHEGSGWKWVLRSSDQSKQPPAPQVNNLAEEAARQAEIEKTLKAREERMAKESAEKAASEQEKSKESNEKQEEETAVNGHEAHAVKPSPEKPRKGKDAKDGKEKGKDSDADSSNRKRKRARSDSESRDRKRKRARSDSESGSRDRKRRRDKEKDRSRGREKRDKSRDRTKDRSRERSKDRRKR